MSTGKKEVVCVTGVSGFVGSHVCRAFLEAGYHVQGTVRDANNAERTNWIKKLAEGTPGSLELYSADLFDRRSLERAVEGAAYVVHTAAAVLFKVKDPQKEVVDVAVEGTRNVLEATKKARCAKRFVYTSSVAAIEKQQPPKNGTILNEEDWNVTKVTVRDAYHMGKTLAERLVFQAYEEQPKGGWRFELVTIVPGAVLGPIFDKQHLRTSPQLVQQLLNGTFPRALDANWNVVDVRDLARGHLEACENSRASGRYILAHGEPTHTLEMSAILKEKYPSSKAPSKLMPNFILYIMALFHPAMSWNVLNEILGPPSYYSTAKIEKELDFTQRPVRDTVIDTAESIYKLDLLYAKA